MFACPSGEAEPEGRTQETAISLPGVAKEEMTALLQFFYSRCGLQIIVADKIADGSSLQHVRL